MFLLRLLARNYLLNRLFRGRGRRSAMRTRGRGGFFGPFPYYSGRTRRGSRVTVSGCCLPIPLVMVSALGLGARLLARR